MDGCRAVLKTAFGTGLHERQHHPNAHSRCYLSLSDTPLLLSALHFLGGLCIIYLSTYPDSCDARLVANPISSPINALSRYTVYPSP